MCKRLTTEEWINKAIFVHGKGKWDYSEVKYISNREKVSIKCKKHGLFRQRPYDHLIGKKCLICGKLATKTKTSSTTNEFLKKARKRHGKTYDYPKAKYKNNRSKLIITCKIHGDFKQRATDHLNGRGCQKCSKSKGEKIISEIFIKNKVDFIPEKRFKECRNLLPLPFDFYIPSKRTLVEYNGRQHYESVSVFGGEEQLKKQQLHDKIKKSYADSNGYDLIVISYKQEKNIEKILKKKLGL
jgi:hypothetical protein